MLDKYSEYFLEEYFLIESLLGNDPGKNVFYSLADIFGVKKAAIVDLYSITQKSEVKEIKTHQDYNRYLRIRQYLGIYGNRSEEYWEEIATVKGQALSYASKYELCAKEGTPSLTVQKDLMQRASKGYVAALRTVGILQALGEILDKNRESGLSALKKAAEWGDIKATLAALKFDAKQREENFKRLVAETEDTPYDFLTQMAEKKYGLKSIEKDERITLLKDAFNQQKANPDVYDPIFNRVLQSGIINIEDKTKILLSGNVQLIAQVADLPLKMTFKAMDYQGLEQLFARSDEKRKIDTVLKNNDLRASSSFKPLCVVSDDWYLLSAYLKKLKSAFSTQRSEVFNLSELNELDLDTTPENVLIRGLNESNNNVLFLIIRGDISQGVLTRVQDFLKSTVRKNFRLRNPAISLNVSSVLPVCLCDKENAEKLSAVVDEVKLADLDEKELPLAIKDVFKWKCKKALVSNGVIEDDAIEKLALKGIDTAEKIIDAAIKELRSGTVLLNEENLRKYVLEIEGDRKSYGFGGKLK